MLVCLGLTATFAFHIRHGRHGLEARSRLIEHSALIEFEIRSLEGVVSRLSRDVALLRPDEPHSDIVESIARDVLGYAHTGEIIIQTRR